MPLPSLSNAQVSGKRVLIRADLDFDISGYEDNPRYQSLTATLDFLKEKKCSIVIIAHKGRPQGVDESLSLKPFQKIFDKWEAKALENLRFNKGEEKNDPAFAKELSSQGDFFVNEAFAASHRNHASIVNLPTLLPHAAGFHFLKEVENLSKVMVSTTPKPAIVVISGIKQDKLDYVEPFKKFSDKILIAGRLPEFIYDTSPWRKDSKVIVANLTTDREDITIRSIENFIDEIKKAGTIILSGPCGKYEEEGNRQGTDMVFKAVANSQAFKLAGGGDTYEAIKLLKLIDQFNWISVGGGAMLEFFAKGILPGIKALLEHN